MVKVLGLAFAFLLIMISFPCAYSQEQPCAKGAVRTVEGAVVSVDWVSSAILVKWLDTSRGFNYDELLIRVTHNTRITKGTEQISLSDINVGDTVSVTYCVNSFTGLEAIDIIVEI